MNTKKNADTPKPPSEAGQASNSYTIDAEQASQFMAAMELLKPLTEFHRAVEDAQQHDMRIIWDVRVVQGKDKPFRHLHGSSSLPGMLAPKMRPNAPCVIEGELMEKIVKPMIAALMDEVERLTFEGLEKRRQASAPITGEECFPAPRQKPSEDGHD